MSDSVTEYAVLDRTAGRITPPLGRGYESRADAEAWIATLERRRVEFRTAAAANEASGFEGGNGDWWNYHKDGWKDADWVVVERTISPWYLADPERAYYRAAPREDGFWALEYRSSIHDTWDTAPRRVETKEEAEEAARGAALSLRQAIRLNGDRLDTDDAEYADPLPATAWLAWETFPAWTFPC